MDLESNDRVPTGLPSEESTAFNSPVDRLSEKKEDEETVASPVTTPTPGADDFPDGGLVAWCVVVGVSQLNRFFVFENFLMPVRSCSRRVLFSRRKLHSTRLLLDSRLTSDGSLSFGLVNAWGVRASRSLLLVDLTAHL